MNITDHTHWETPLLHRDARHAHREGGGNKQLCKNITPRYHNKHVLLLIYYIALLYPCDQYKQDLRIISSKLLSNS